MKAQIIKAFGDYNVFVAEEVAKPIIKPHHVIIKVAATSINPVDCKIRSGLYSTLANPFPAILHCDVAGTIVEVGEGVTQFKVGDEVYGSPGGIKPESGALAEYMLADAALIAHKPKNLNFIQSAALPLVCLTAWEALFEKTHLSSGQCLLVHAGTGGVGHIAIQLGRWAGAHVSTTVSSDAKATIVKSLGANEVINYRTETVAQYVERITKNQGFDIVFDTVGGHNLDLSIAAMGLKREVVTIQANSTHDLSPLQAKCGSLHVESMLIPLLYNLGRENHGIILAKIAELVETGVLKPLIDQQHFKFDDISLAHQYFESGQAIGKVVVEIR